MREDDSPDYVICFLFQKINDRKNLRSMVRGALSLILRRLVMW